MELFKPSIDWSHALVDSLRWIALAWVISAVCVVAVLALLRLLTPWGRQFWRITGGYFVGRRSLPVWLMLAVLLLSLNSFLWQCAYTHEKYPAFHCALILFISVMIVTGPLAGSTSS